MRNLQRFRIDWEFANVKYIIAKILTIFWSGSLSKVFTKDEQSDISLNGTIYDLSVDHSLIKKEDKFIIHQYLMVEKDIK